MFTIKVWSPHFIFLNSHYAGYTSLSITYLWKALFIRVVCRLKFNTEKKLKLPIGPSNFCFRNIFTPELKGENKLSFTFLKSNLSKFKICKKWKRKISSKETILSPTKIERRANLLSHVKIICFFRIPVSIVHWKRLKSLLATDTKCFYFYMRMIANGCQGGLKSQLSAGDTLSFCIRVLLEINQSNNKWEYQEL